MRHAFLALILCLAPAAGLAPGAAAAVEQDLQCSKCKAKLKPGAKFCTECGTLVPEQVCAKCKKPMLAGAKFCTNCGTKVEDAPAPKPEEKPKPEAPKPEIPKPETPKPETPKPEAPKPDADKPAPKPAGPVGQDVDADKVKATLDAELRKFGTSAEEVNRAIDRGAAFLAAQYAKSDLSSDEDYLAAYALINTSQYQTNGKLREKIHAFLRRDHWVKSSAAVYVAGLRALALEATRDPDLRNLTRECAEYLVETQGPKGTWTYRETIAMTPALPPGKDGKESGLSVSGGEPLDEEVKGEEVPKKGTCKNPSDGDNSCTQFAVLGLHAAAKCGFAVPREAWEKCLKEMEQRHCGDGGWAYHDGGKGRTSYGSMTCAGICTMALCRFYLGEKNYLENEKVQAGLQWLGKNFSVSENPKSNGQWPLYYIYSVERVGVFAGTESIGEHRWYPMGAKHLVGIQKQDGSWQTNFEDAKRGTSLALLFLTRATAPVKALKRGGAGVLETHLVNDSTNILFILDASGSMRDEMDGKEKFQIVKDVVESIVKKLPEGALVGLRVYGHRKTALDEHAELDSELLIPIGPLNPDSFVARVKALKCKGMTPLTYSMTEAIKDVSHANPGAEVVTILLTDGGETTRGAKPPEAAAKLAASRKGMRVHVVGFDISDDDWREQLEKTAAAGNGKYFHARKADDLLNALSLATVGAAEYTLLDKAGKELIKGKLGDRHPLPEGKYVFSIAVDGKKEEKTVWINTEITSHVSVTMSKLLNKK
jgi:Mg-chelatase subunit ChlD